VEGDDGNFIYVAAVRWAELDPEGLLAYLLLYPGGIPDKKSQPIHLYGSLLTTWAKKDPEKALAAGIAMINANAHLLTGIDPHFYREDWQTLTTAFAGIDDRTLREKLLQKATYQYMSEDPEAIWNWWRTADAETQRTVATSFFYYDEDANKPMTSADLSRLKQIAAETKDGKLAANVLRMANESGGFHEPFKESLEWAQSTIPGRQRPSAIANIFGQPCKMNPTPSSPPTKPCHSATRKTKSPQPSPPNSSSPIKMPPSSGSIPFPETTPPRAASSPPHGNGAPKTGTTQQPMH
jgi:hypothetical protein